MSHRPGTPYVVFRSDQYNYYLFYGDGLRLAGSVFSGSGSYVRYYSSTGAIYRGTDTVNIDAGIGFVYSNMSDQYPAFYEERSLLNAKVILFGVVLLVLFFVVSRILSR
jgi:hypothetical protein